MKKHIEAVHKKSGGGGAVYGLGFVGALFYFLQDLNSFSQLFWGILKAIVWPAIIVYKAFGAF